MYLYLPKVERNTRLRGALQPWLIKKLQAQHIIGSIKLNLLVANTRCKRKSKQHIL